MVNHVDDIEQSVVQRKVEILCKLQQSIYCEAFTTDDIVEANHIAEELLRLTKHTYDAVAETYARRRQSTPHEIDIAILDKLLRLARTRFAPSEFRPLRILDTGTAYGRDIKYISGLPHIRIVGIDISDAFIRILARREKDRDIPRGSFLKCDMRDLSIFHDESFEVVRHNASLVHLPIIAEGYMVDLALQESFRVLRKGGLMHVSVKEGTGLQYVDTNEGLGRIPFQFHSMDSVSSLLERNGFAILSRLRRPSSRGPRIKWLSVISEKP